MIKLKRRWITLLNVIKLKEMDQKYRKVIGVNEVAKNGEIYIYMMEHAEPVFHAVRQTMRGQWRWCSHSVRCHLDRVLCAKTHDELNTLADLLGLIYIYRCSAGDMTRAERCRICSESRNSTVMLHFHCNSHCNCNVKCFGP